MLRGEPRYNPSTGDYQTTIPEKTLVMAAVYDTSAADAQIVYGDIQVRSKTFHIKNHYDDPFSYIEIDGKKYKPDSVQTLRQKQIFICSEVI